VNWGRFPLPERFWGFWQTYKMQLSPAYPNDCFWPKADIENTEIQRTFDYLQIHEIEGRFRPKVL
jgi:hypothetical protein